MRRTILGLAVGLGLGLVAPASGWAQMGGANTSLGADPFSLYYGWYLPNQAYQASRPRVEDTINSITAARQYNALAERAGLFDQTAPYGEEEFDAFRTPSGAGRRGGERARMTAPGSVPRSIRGLGPELYYNRLAHYYPGVRSMGRGTNKNLATHRAPRGGYGMSMPSMGMGMPGPR